MQVWLDDKRPMPAWATVHVTNAHDCMLILSTLAVRRISLDHDLGPGLTGYDVACHIERCAIGHRIPRLAWSVHSANGPGAARIIAAMRSAERAWDLDEGTPP